MPVYLIRGDASGTRVAIVADLGDKAEVRNLPGYGPFHGVVANLITEDQYARENPTPSPDNCLEWRRRALDAGNIG